MKRLMECGFLSFGIEVNEHRTSYDTIETQMERPWCDPEDIVPGSSMAQMVDTDTMIRLQIYPSTPIGSADFIGHDLEGVIQAALQWAKGDRQ